MKRIVAVSLGSTRRNYECTIELLGERFHIRRIGTDGDTRLAARLVKELDGQADAIALGAMNIQFRVGRHQWNHLETLKIARSATSTPVVGGRSLKEVVGGWALGHLTRREPALFQGRRALVISGINHAALSEKLEEEAAHLTFADPILHFGVPMTLSGPNDLARYARATMPLLVRRPYVSFFPKGRVATRAQAKLLQRWAAEADVVVGDLRELLVYAPEHLEGRIVITDTVDEDAIQEFRRRGVALLCTTTPDLSQVTGQPIDLHVLHAIFVAHLGGDPSRITRQRLVELLDALGTPPRIIQPQGRLVEQERIAYLLTAQSQNSIFHHPAVSWMRLLAPERRQRLEKLAARLPAFYACSLNGVRSPTGGGVTASVYFWPATPAQIAKLPPHVLHARIDNVIRAARAGGARLLSISSFSAELAEVARQRAATTQLPITTGGAYTVATTLWACRDACKAMGLPFDEQGLTNGLAVVVGASSPMARAGAQLLALTFRRLVLVETEEHRVAPLTRAIEERSPHCEVIVARSPRGYLEEADLVLLGFGESHVDRLDLDRVKPGAVVCDGGRPSRLRSNAMEERPDVVFLLAGEVELPGPAEFTTSLGLPPKVAYPCLGEGLLLALEGRFECFTLGAELSLDQVKEIYKMGGQHGFNLASLRGPQGPMGRTELSLIRERAEARRRESERPPPLELPADGAS